MVKWPFVTRRKYDALLNQFGTPDHDAFADELRASALGRDYTAVDQYRDFRAVFMGSPQGRRVLWKLLEWGHMYRSIAHPDANMTYLQEGERNIGLKVLRVLNFEPSIQGEE